MSAADSGQSVGVVLGSKYLFGSDEEGFRLDYYLIPFIFRWLTQHPFGAAMTMYVIGVVSVLLYTYFEPREQTYRRL